MAVIRDAAHFNELLSLVEENNTKIGRPELIELIKEPEEVINFKLGRVKRQYLSAEATHWLATESMNKHKRSVLEFSSLSRWLERDTWTPKEALTILTGLDPNKSSIEWTRSSSSEADATPIIREACFFADFASTFSLPHSHSPGQPKSELLIAIEDSRALGFKEAVQEYTSQVLLDQELALAEVNRQKGMQLRHRSEMLECISERWYSSLHDTTSRQIPIFFTQWAEALGFKIEWASWAREKNLLARRPELNYTSVISGDTWSNDDSENNQPLNVSAPVPLTTTEIAEYFCDFRWKTPEAGRKILGKKPAWLRNCVATAGSRGKFQINWYPVEVGAKLIVKGYAKESQILSRFKRLPRLHEWLEVWKDYAADNFSTD